MRFTWLYAVFDDLRSVLEFAVSLRCETGLRITDITVGPQTHGTPRARTYSLQTHSTGEKQMKLDSGGGRKILNGFINFTVESTHTYSSRALTPPLSVC